MPDYKKLFEVMQSRRIIDANIPDADTWGSSLINDETRLKATHKALVFDMKMSGAKTPPPSYEEFVGMLSPLKKKADTPVSGGGVQPVSPVSTGGSEVDPLFPPPTEKPKPLTKEQKALAAKGLSGGIPVEEAEQMAKDVKLRELDTKTPDWTRNIADEIGEVPDAPDPRNYQPFDAFGTPLNKAKELTDQEVVDFYNTNRNNPQMGGDPMNFPLLGVQGARKAREFYNAQFKPENNPKYKADLAAYNLKMDKLKAENPVMAMPVEIVREGKALRQKADKLGITPKELFESKRGQLADTYLTDEFKQENEVLGRLEYAQEQYKKFLRNSLTTKLGSDTYKGELERLGTEVKRAQEDYVKYQLQMTDSIDGQIKALKTQLGALEDEGDIRDVQRQIKQLEQRKELFINPQAGIGVAEEVLKVGRITSHDQIQEAYLALSNHRDKLKAKFEAETGTIAPVGGAVQQEMQRYLSGNFGFMTGGDTLKELAKVEEQLTALAPIALVNRSPIGDDMGSMERFWKSALKVISPGANRAGQKLTSQDLSKNTFEFLDVMQAEGLVPQKQTEALGEAGEQPKFNTPDWWADTMGVTAGILPSFAIGGGVLTGVKGAFALTRGGAAMLETLAAIKQGVKTQPLARAIYSGIESGIEYKAVGTLFSANPTVSEEGTFAAGFLGGVLSSPIEALDLDVIGAKVLGVFGKKADDFTVATQRVGRVIKAAGILNQRGIAETLEEYGNEIGNMYMESDTWADMKGQLEERFGTLDQNVEFIVATYVMGMGMGLPSVAGKLALERSSRAYNEASPETRAKVDEILPAVNEAVGVENVPPAEQPPVGGSAPKTPPQPPADGGTPPKTPPQPPADGGTPPSDVDLEAEEIARRQREEAGLGVPVEETAVEEVPAPPVVEQATADVGGVKSPDVSLTTEGVKVKTVDTVGVDESETGVADAVTEQAVEATAKALERVDFNIEKLNTDLGKGFVSNEQISEAYHKAKADGSNPELVQAVEDLLGAPKETPARTKAKVEQAVETPTESKPDVRAEAPKADVVTSVEEIVSPTENQIPKAVEKKPDQEVRAKGVRSRDGVSVKRPENLKQDEVVFGNQGKATYKPGETTNVPYRFRLMRLDRAIPTQKRLIWNPLNFLWDSQPKPLDNKRVAENDSRAANFENEQIGPSGASPFLGFVNVNARGEVFQGTGRWNILNGNPKQAERIAYLKSPEVVAVTGITPEQIDAFVAANPNTPIDIFRDYNVTDNQAVRLGQYDSKEAESDVKGTKENQVVGKLTEAGLRKVSNAIASLKLQDGKPVSVSQMWNDIAENVMKVLQEEKILSPTEASKMIERESGKLTAAGEEFMRAIAYNIVYVSSSSKIESLPSAIQDKLADIIPFLLSVAAEKQINDTMARVVDILYDLEKSKLQDVPTWSKQKIGTIGKMPVDMFTPLEIAIADMISKKGSSKARVMSLFRDFLRQTTGYAELFGETPPVDKILAAQNVFGYPWTDYRDLEQDRISEVMDINEKTTASEAKASKLSGLKKKKKPDEFKDEATPLEAVASERGNVGEVSASYGSKNAFQEAISSAVSTAMVLGGKVFNRLSGRAKDGKTPRKRKYYSGSTVAKGMAANGRVDVSSVDANNPVALAELFGFIRNPFVENTVVAFTKGGRVVSYSVLSSGLFNTTPSGISELGKGVGADGFYLIHNHPSGNPTPSSSDVRITREASEQGKAKGLEMRGSLVLNGGKFASVRADGTHEMLSYGEKSFFEAGSDARNLAGQAAFILNDTGSQYALVFSDAQEKIIDWHPIPSNLEGQALTSYVSSLYKARGGANVRIIGDATGVGTLFKDAKTPSNTLEVIDPYTGDVYKVDGSLLDMTLADGMMDEASSEIPSNLDPEGVETLTEVVIDTIRAGQSPTLEFLIKNLIAEEMEEWIPELVFAYQRVRAMPNVTIEIRNEMSSSARIGELSSPDGIKKLKEEYAKEQEQKQREREASERRKALIGDLDIAERPVYDRGTGGYDGANAGRPVLRYALPVGADVSASDVVVEVIKEGQYRSIDEHQRYGVNAILTNFKKGFESFMLADGPGVGKSLQLIVAAIEGYKMTGKKSLIVTENRAIVAKNFVADGTSLLGRLYFPEIEFVTYSSLDKVKGDYGFVLLDEAHNMKNATSQKSQAAMALSRQADFTVYSTATPADKATHLYYWLPQMLGVSQLDVEEMLGFETISVHLKGEKTPRLEAKFNIPFAEYLQRLVGLRNKLIAEGKMLRRNYPFYGSVGEALMGVPQEAVDIENKIEEYFNRKGKAIRSMMAKRNASPSEIEGALRRNNETKVGYQERALEPYKLPYVNSVVQTELDAGRKVVIMFAAAADEVSIELSKTDKVTVPNAIKQMQDKLKQQGVVYGLMTGKTREDNAQTAENFRKGRIKVVMGTFQSMSTGIDLDDQIGDQPVTLVMASFPKSAQIFEQALFRVSRRNTKSPAKVITVFAKTPSDNRARKRFESKAQVMNSINEGTAQTDNITDSSFDPSFVAETQTAGVLVPRMVYNEDNNTFSVVNLNGVYERLIAVGGGQYRKGGDLGNRVVFPITAIADVQRVLDDYVSTSDTRETLQQIHDKNVEEFWRAVRASRGTTNINLPNMWPVMVSLGKMAASYIAVNGAKLQGFLNLVKKFGKGFLPVAKSIFIDMVNLVRKPMRKTPRGIAAKAYNELTEIEKKIFDNHLKWAEGTSQNYAQYMSKLNALIVGLSQQQNPSSKAVSKALETFRAYAMTMQANSVTDMEVYKKSIALDTEARIGGEAVKGALSSPTFSFSDMIAKVRRNLRLATSKIDRPFKAITTEFENPIRNRYAKPLSRDRHEMLLEHQAEALKGVVGRAILNRDRIWKEVTGGTTINGEFSPRLSKAERVLFEYYLFARRAKDRVSVKIDKDGNEIKTSTGNVSAAMADAMIAYVINALPDSRSIQDFEGRADVFQTVMDDNLQMLLKSGKISQASYDAIKERNDFYATFKVVQEGLSGDGATKYDNSTRADASIVKKMRGIASDIAKKYGIRAIDDLAIELSNGAITLDDFFTRSSEELDLALTAGTINEAQYLELVSTLGSAGFQVTSILEAAESILYRSVISSERNMFVNKMAEMAEIDVDKETAYVAPLQISQKYEDFDTPTMQAIPFSKDGIRMVLVVDRAIATAMQGLTYKQLSWAQKAFAVSNKMLRAAVITSSTAFFITNSILDAVSLTFQSKLGLLMGAQMDKPILNVPMQAVRLPFDLTYSFALSLTYRLANFKAWKKSSQNRLKQMGIDLDKDVFGNYLEYVSDPAFVSPWQTANTYTFSDEGQKAWASATKFGQLISKIPNTFYSLLELVSGVSDETIKITAFNRKKRLEAAAKRMAANDVNSIYNDTQVLMDYASQLSREVRNTGSPDFANIPPQLQALALVFPMIGARVKGILWDLRRTSLGISSIGYNMAKLLPKNNAIRQYYDKANQRYAADTTESERNQIMYQQIALMATLSTMAAALFFKFDDDDDEDIPKGLSYKSFSEALELFYPNLSKDYINIPTGNFYETEVSYIDPSGNTLISKEVVPEFFQIRVRGTLKAAWNGVYEGSKSGGDVTTKTIKDIIGILFEEVSPINIRGKTTRDKAESVISGLTPAIKTPYEVMANRNSYTNRYSVSMFKMLRYEQYQRDLMEGNIDIEYMEQKGYAPWQIYNPYNSDPSDDEISKFLYNNFDIMITSQAVNTIRRGFGMDEYGRGRRMVSPAKAIENMKTSSRRSVIDPKIYFNYED